MGSNGEHHKWPRRQRVIGILHAGEYEIAKGVARLLQPRPDGSEAGRGNVEWQKAESKEPGLAGFFSQGKTRAWPVESSINERRNYAQSSKREGGVAEPV